MTRLPVAALSVLDFCLSVLASRFVDSDSRQGRPYEVNDKPTSSLASGRDRVSLRLGSPRLPSPPSPSPSSSPSPSPNSGLSTRRLTSPRIAFLPLLLLPPTTRFQFFFLSHRRTFVRPFPFRIPPSPHLPSFSPFYSYYIPVRSKIRLSSLIS